MTEALSLIQAAMAIIQAARTLLPELIALLNAVEASMPNSPADAKIDMVKAVLQSSIKGIDITTSDVWPVVLKILDQHAATAPTAATVAA